MFLFASTTEIIALAISSISLIVAMLAYYRTVPRLKFILMKSRLLKNNNETITLRVYFTISNQTNAPANIFHIACFSHKKNFNVSDPTEKWGRFQPIYLSAYESQPYIVSADFLTEELSKKSIKFIFYTATKKYKFRLSSRLYNCDYGNNHATNGQNH